MKRIINHTKIVIIIALCLSAITLLIHNVRPTSAQTADTLALLSDFSRGAENAQIVHNIAYIESGDNGLVRVDVSDPVTPSPCPESGVWPEGCVPVVAPGDGSSGTPCPAVGLWPDGCVPPTATPSPTPGLLEPIQLTDLRDNDRVITTYPANMIAHQGRTYFIVDGWDSQLKSVWMSDGTAEGTEPLTVPASAGLYERIVTCNDHLFLIAEDALLNIDSDGQVTMLHDEPLDGGVEWNGTCLFAYNNASLPLQSDGSPVPYQAGVWQSDGTAAGTSSLWETAPSTERLYRVSKLTDLGDGQFLFRMRYYDEAQSATISEIWLSDGNSFRKVADHAEIVGITDSAIFLGTPASDAIDGIESWEAIDYDGNLLMTMPTGYPDPATGYLVVGVVNDRLVFTAPNSPNDTESSLWSSDGTAANTTVLKLLNDNFSVTGEGMAYNGKLYFPAHPIGLYYLNNEDPVLTDFGVELHSTDGIEPASMIFDFNDGGSFNPRDFVVANDRLYFVATTGNGNSIHWWSSDGTSSGMGAVSNARIATVATNFVLVDDLFYFIGDDGTHDLALWRVDPSAEDWTQAHSFADINPTGDAFAHGGDLTLVSDGDNVYFAAYNVPGVSNQMWTLPLQAVPDTPVTPTVTSTPATPTATSTPATPTVTSTPVTPTVTSTPVTPTVTLTPPAFQPVQLTNLPVEDEIGTHNGNIVDYEGRTYFIVQEDGNLQTQQVWMTDGTVAGTQPISIPAGRYFNFSSCYGMLFVMTADALWRIHPDGQVIQLHDRRLTVGAEWNGDCLFGFYHEEYVPPPEYSQGGENGYYSGYAQLWRSDGTPAGTVNLEADRVGYDTNQIIDLGNDQLLLMQSNNETLTYGYIQTFVQIGDGNSFRRISYHPEFIAKTESMFFLGTPVGYILPLNEPSWTAYDLDGNVLDTMPTEMPIDTVGEINGRFVFIAQQRSGEDEPYYVWSTDGTADGTIQLTPTATNAEPLTPQDTLYFVSTLDGEAKVYATDGNTLSVVDTIIGTDSQLESFEKYSFTVENDTAVLYFTAVTNGNRRLYQWSTDGQNSTVRPVSAENTPISERNFDNERTQIVEVDGQFYFIGDDGISGRELWQVDPLSDSTHQLTDINLYGDSFSTDKFLTAPIFPNGDDIYFVAHDDTENAQLWVIPSQIETAESIPQTEDVPLNITLNGMEADLFSHLTLWTVLGLLAAVTATIYGVPHRIAVYRNDHPVPELATK